VIKRAGFRWKKARVALTSTDPEYKGKVEVIRSTLAGLRENEAFFSIDEFGPFAIKMTGGRSLRAPNDVKSIPQWQSSKGSLIVTAGLELSSNQMLHFFSENKNSAETIKLIQIIRNSYKGYRTVFLSWDAAPWHSSKDLYDRIDFLNGWATYDSAPTIEILPLPSKTQFLNVIESVFSGMARAILHNSHYPSVQEAKSAIDCYIGERNRKFTESPRRAGKAIWGKERAPSTFLEDNNCKDPLYR
jgi:hypothetical protein